MRTEIDFLGIGVEKGGTTWLAKCLNEHPQLCFPPNREIYFFNDVDSHFLKKIKSKYSRGFEWYKNQFKHCPINSKKGEWATTYLFSKKTAQRIKKHLPNIQLIVSFRDPVTRTFSQYLYELRLGLVENISFEEMLKKRPDYIEKGFYAKYLSYYYELFDKKNIKVIIFEEMINNKEKTLKEIFKFLNVDDNFMPSLLTKPQNPAGIALFPKLNLFMLRFEYTFRELGLDRILQIFEESGLRGFAMKIRDINVKEFNKYPKMKIKTKQKLYKIFKSDINQLEKITGKNLRIWKDKYE